MKIIAILPNDNHLQFAYQNKNIIKKYPFSLNFIFNCLYNI